MPDALEALERKAGEDRVASAPRKTRRTGKGKEAGGSSVGQPVMATDGELAAVGEDGSLAPSSTLERTQDDEVVFDGEGMSAEQRRRAKGKGKAVEQDEIKMENGAEEVELTRLRKELAASMELMAQQQAALASVQSAIACAICTEPLDRPYSLQCGHVFCRKCLVTWFFRADPDEEDRQNAAQEQAIGSSSSSSSSSSDSEDDASSSSGSIHSHMGGHINGRAFNVTGLEGADDERKRRLFEMGNEALLRFGFDLPGGGTAQNGRITGDHGEAEGSDGSRIVEIEEDKEEEEKQEKQLTRDELRQKRLAALARFGFDISLRSKEPSIGGSFAEVQDEAKGDEQPPVAGPSTSRPAPAPSNAASALASTSRRLEPAAHAAHAPPAPPKSPLKPRSPPPSIPTGAHRAKNLVCPSCRANCSEHAPNRVFVLDEIITLLRRSGVDESGSVIGSSAGAWRARTETAEDAWPAMVEADESWGGLYPGPGGRESASDRRRRLAQVVRDRDDGVRRCGECNWELDERTGICEGCGRRWDISDDDSDDDSNDGYTVRGSLGFGFGRHRLGRQHHDVDLSASDADDSEFGSQRARAALYDSQESYESDFVVKSDEEAEQERERTEARLRRRREAVRRRQRRLEASESESKGSGSSASSLSSKSGSSSSEEEEDSDDERTAPRRRRARRQQGEVIDVDSDTSSIGNGSQDSSDGSGDGSSGSGSDSDSGSSRDGGRGFVDDEVSVRKSKKKRIILDSEEEEDE
ncbi:hypothetical protein JCM10295v2_003951 [Rhodotorula toruloides]